MCQCVGISHSYFTNHERDRRRGTHTHLNLPLESTARPRVRPRDHARRREGPRGRGRGAGARARRAESRRTATPEDARVKTAAQRISVLRVQAQRCHPDSPRITSSAEIVSRAQPFGSRLHTTSTRSRKVLVESPAYVEVGGNGRVRSRTLGECDDLWESRGIVLCSLEGLGVGKLRL